MAMTNKGAIETLQANVIFACEKAGLSNAAIRMTEDALDMAIAALEKEVWKEEHPVSPLQTKKDSDPPTEDNSCMYCNKRMGCYRYITWLGDPLDLFAPKVDGCDKFDKNKN